MKTVYLCGGINGLSDAQAKDWREESNAALSPHYRVFDPMVRDYRGRELEPGIAREIVEQDKADVDASDILLVHYERPSVGTSMEVLYAKERGKTVYLVDRSGKPLSPWLLYHADRVFGSLTDALYHLAGPPA
jgi:nucleoside 2-deoxyribosyltransferase